MTSAKAIKKASGQHWLWGNLRAFQQDALATIEKARRAGDLVRWRFGPLQFYQANDPKLVHQVLVRNAAKFHKTDRNKRVFRPVIGEGLLISDGAFWRRQRSLVQPAFHSRRIEAYGEAMVGEALAMLKRWRQQNQVELHLEMMRVTLAIVARTLFDTQLGDQDFHRVSKAMDVVLARANDRFERIIDLPEWLPTPANRQAQVATDQLDHVLRQIIEARRNSSKDRGDLMSMLLFSQDEQGRRMTDDQVRDEAMTLFLAGHETTANALTWTWTLLSRHPQILEQLQDEVESVAPTRHVTVDDLESLKLHDRVIKEAMRLYPPAWIIARQATKEVVLGDYRLPEGARIFISAWGIHRDPSIYDQPLSFRPDRFTEQETTKRSKYAYIPFGAGPRICIGNAFASMEAQLVLATMVKHVKVELRPDQDLSPEPLVTLRPLKPIPVNLTWRSADFPRAQSISTS